MEDSVSDVKMEEATPVEGIETQDVLMSDEAEAVAVPVKKQKKPINQQKLQDNIWGWAFCLPLIVGTTVFVFIAFILAVILSFSQYSSASSGPLFEYVFGGGLKAAESASGEVSPFYWYMKMVLTSGDKTYFGSVQGLTTWRTLFNAVFYMIGIPIGMIISMVFAVLMSRDIKGGGVFRIIYYLPVISSTVAISVTFRNLFETDGIINSIFHSNITWLYANGINTQGMSDAQAWFIRGLILKVPILVMCIWKGLGGTIILFCAGLSGVNAATKEAASIDGANSWQIFWKVTMPDLYPTIFYTIVTSVIGGMQIYAEPQLLFNQGAGIMEEVDGFVALIWQVGLTNTYLYNTSYGCALGMLLFVIVLLLTLFQFYLDKRNKE